MRIFKSWGRLGLSSSSARFPFRLNRCCSAPGRYALCGLQWAWLSLLPFLFFAGEAAAQTVRFNDTPAPISEGTTSLNVAISLVANPPFNSATDISYDVGGTATNGSDFTTLSGTLNFPSNLTGVTTIIIPIINDDIDEDAETIIITLTAGNGYTLDSNTANISRTLTINDNDTAGVTITESGTPPSTSVAENGGTDDYEVELDSEPTADVTITPSSGTTSAATVSPTTLTFTASTWDTAQTVTVTGVNDDVIGSRASTITHAATSSDGKYNGISGIDSVSVTVVDDDFPTVTITGGSAVTEGSNATFTVTRTGATTGALTVLLAVSENETSGRDFVTSANQGNKTVEIPANSATATYTVATVADSTDEPNGVVTVALRSNSAYTSGSPSSATVTVNDDDNVAPTVANAIPNQATVVGTAFSFAFAANAFTDGDGDTLTYLATQGNGSALPSWLTFTAASRTFSGTPQSANVGTVTVKVTASDSNSGSVSDNFDIVVTALPVVTITGGSAVTEGSNATFTVSRTGATTAALTVLLSVRENEANGRDFVTSANQGNKEVEIASGDSSATYTVATVGDSTHEPNGEVRLFLRASASAYTRSNSSATVTVNDNDAPQNPTTPSVSFASASMSVAENAGSFQVQVNLSPAPTSNFNLAYTRTGGTATIGPNDSTDDAFTANSSPIAVVAGSSNVKIEFLVWPDTSNENDETIVLMLSNGTGYMVGSPFEHTVTITDDDGGGSPTLPTVSITGGSAVTEGSPATFTVSRTGATTSALTVLLAVSETTSGGQDFVASGDQGNKQVIIPINSLTATYPVATVNDSTAEPNGAVTVALRPNAAAYTSGSPSSATVNVSDDDGGGGGSMGLTFSPSELPVTEGGSNTYTVKLSSEPTGDVDRDHHLGQRRRDRGHG